MPSEIPEKMAAASQDTAANAIVIDDPRTTQVVSLPDPFEGCVFEASRRSDVGNVKDIEKKSASNIALIITWTFSGSAALLLVGLYFILLRNLADAKLLLDAAVPALKETGTFLSTVFGPLLGFVLGYYFRDRKDRD